MDRKNKIEILKVFGTIEVLLTAFVMTGIFNMAAFIIIKFGVGAIIIKFYLMLFIISLEK